MKHYETPSVVCRIMATEDVVRTSSTADTVVFDANSFLQGGIEE